MRHPAGSFHPRRTLCDGCGRPNGPLSASDFTRLGEVVDPYLAQGGSLDGVIVDFPKFPGWDSLDAMVAHLNFVREHHSRIHRVAVVTDAPLGEMAEKLAAKFVTAEIRNFRAGDVDGARQWIATLH